MLLCQYAPDTFDSLQSALSVFVVPVDLTSTSTSHQVSWLALRMFADGKSSRVLLGLLRARHVDTWGFHGGLEIFRSSSLSQFWCLYGGNAVIGLSCVYRWPVGLRSIGNKKGALRGLRLEKFWTHLNDVSDSQWRNFRQNLPILSLAMALLSLTNNTIRRSFSLQGKGTSCVLLAISLIYILYLHGACSLFLLAIAVGNFLLAKVMAGNPAFPALVWMYNLVFLVSNRVYEGYSFSYLGEELAFLDNHRGAQRWHISFNFVMLRMVSFGLDYHWACISRLSTIDWEKHSKSCDVCQLGSDCYLKRQEKSLSLSEYSMEFYVSYLFYPPLYIAGPIISFNAFASQLELSQASHSKVDVVLYGLRWISCLAFMELLTHYCYFNSLAISGIWQNLSPWEVFAVGYGVLNFMWLKFLLIWRFFRFWALVDGVETVENMPHCINNCYDLEGFWKSWHASYNRWLVRYLYIPLGGARYRILNIWVIFTFVAVWHDLEWYEKHIAFVKFVAFLVPFRTA
ncbi:hypothetical protein L7F22_011063 [Adiantum nelumboides]|nr:hypothetical protein [Adiantum nelumboides]